MAPGTRRRWAAVAGAAFALLLICYALVIVAANAGIDLYWPRR